MKCKICNRYIEHQEFLNSRVCSAICLGKSFERERILEILNNFNFGEHLENADIEGEEVYYGFNMDSLLKELDDAIGGKDEN